MTAPAGPDPLDARRLHGRVMAAAALLVEWRARRTTAERSYVSAGHEAMGALDDAAQVLSAMRARLAGEIRQDQLARDVRVDQLLAEVQRERFGGPAEDPAGWQYSRTDDQTVVNGPPPPDVGGYRWSGREDPR